jgi:hypothetical protein
MTSGFFPKFNDTKSKCELGIKVLWSQYFNRDV